MGWVSQRSQGSAYLGHIARVLLLGTCRNSSVVLFSSSQLPGIAVGPATCPWRNGVRQPAPASGDLLLPSSYPFASHTKGSSTGSSHLLSSFHFPLPLLGSSASFPGLYAAPSIPHITCCEQVYLYTLSVMPEVSISWPASEKYNSHCVCRHHEQRGQNAPCSLMPQEQLVLHPNRCLGCGPGFAS